MRIAKILRKDQETILRFLDAFGGGAAALGASNKYATPGFFITAVTFIHEYIEEGFFRKEELLLGALENCGFSPEEGAIGAMKNEQKKSKEAARHLYKAATGWLAGDANARVEVGWASSEYSATLRQNLNRLKNLIFPLLEQNLSPAEDENLAEGINRILVEGPARDGMDRFDKLIETLEDELSDWK